MTRCSEPTATRSNRLKKTDHMSVA